MYKSQVMQISSQNYRLQNLFVSALFSDKTELCMHCLRIPTPHIQTKSKAWPRLGVTGPEVFFGHRKKAEVHRAQTTSSLM